MNTIDAFNKLNEIENSIRIINQRYHEIIRENPNIDKETVIEILPKTYRKIKDIPTFINELIQLVIERQNFIFDNSISVKQSIFEALDTGNPSTMKKIIKPPQDYKGDTPFNHMLQGYIDDIEKDFISPLTDKPEQYKKYKKLNLQELLNTARTTVKFLTGLMKSINNDTDKQTLGCFAFVAGMNVNRLYMKPYRLYPNNSVGVFNKTPNKTENLNINTKILADYIQKHQQELKDYYLGKKTFKWYGKEYPEVKGYIDRLIKYVIYLPVRRKHKSIVKAMTLTNKGENSKYYSFLKKELAFLDE